MKDIYYRVYEGSGLIFYSKSINNGQTWSTLDIVDEGSYPSIALSYDGDTPWILYVKRGQEDVFKCAVRRPDGTSWKIRDIYACEESERTDDYKVGPSLMMAITNPERNDLAYGVFSDNYDRIFFVAFDTIRNYGEPPYQVIDEHYPCLAPSISITPEDRLHVVWQRDVENGKIFYKEAIKVHPDDIRHDILPEWSREIQISTELPQWQTEPASNPSVEAYGEYVYVAWRGPNIEGNSEFGDIWRRARWIPYEDPTIWEEPRNQSETQNSESNYPVMSTNFVTVWQEQADSLNWDIWGKFAPEPLSQPFFESEKLSKFPHITSYTNPKTGELNCYTTWTEEINDPIYEVKFGTKSYIPQKSESGYDFSYYNVDIGESVPSYYCVERTG